MQCRHHARGNHSLHGRAASFRMDHSLSEYRFSSHFNHLACLGMWETEFSTTPALALLLFIARILWNFVCIITFTIQMVHLYYVYDDFEKLTFNLCSSALVIAVVLKILFVYDRRQCVNRLRRALWRDAQDLHHEEDFLALDRAYNLLNLIRYSAHAFIWSTIAIILATSLYAHSQGMSDLPFAAYLPTNYPTALSILTACIVFVACISAENELVGFSLILQLNAHFEILMNEITRLNELYSDDEYATFLHGSDSGPTHPKRADAEVEAKKVIKHCVRRHLQLMQHCKELEYIYSRCMVLQLGIGFLLILMNGVEVFVIVKEFNQKICSQMLIIVMVVFDLLLLCHFTSELTTQCLYVGNTAYSTAWYKMDKDVQRALFMIMIGSMKPPKFTAGKIILIDLHTYMRLLRNILSWLMLIRQLMNQKQ